MNGLVSYGGDPKVTVARAEIERITASLAGVQTRLINELQPMAQINGLIHHLQLDAALPDTLIKLGMQRHGCFVAAETYFSGDAQIAHTFSAIAEVVSRLPWVRNAIPSQVWESLAIGAGALAFTNTDGTALATRTFTSQLPLDTIGRMGSLIPESKIHVEERPPSAVYENPTSLEGLASRLYTSGNIRVEAYETNSGRVVVLYLPGTAEWNPVAHEKAFDVRSDVELLAPSQKSSSYRTANAVLNSFGVTDSDRLIVVGYSQGGMIGSQLATERENVVGLVTMGTPMVNHSLPHNLNVISLEHTNDVVPALAGKTNPITENWVTGSRHVEVAPGENILKAHEMREYLKSAEFADESSDAGMIRMRERVLEPIANARLIEVREYEPLKGAS